jgi:hypothetical protein
MTKKTNPFSYLFDRYGWETQILETTFLGMFLVPLYSLAKIDRHCPPSILFVFLMRFLIARIMLGAGLIKIRGDQCWRDRKSITPFFSIE